MQIIIRSKDEDWKKNFSAVIEIDDRFKTMFGKDFLTEHFSLAIAASVSDIGHSSMGVLMRFLNAGILEMKEYVAHGLAAAIERHEMENGKSEIVQQKSGQPDEQQLGRENSQ